MRDNEIIKALKCCQITNCKDCVYCGCDEYRLCVENLLKDAFDLINRQQVINKQLRDNLQKHMDAEEYLAKLTDKQQAEIERLKKTNPLFEYATKSVHQYIEDGQTYYLDFVNEEREAEAISKKIDYLCNIQDIRAEAIKEFAEKLKDGYSDFDERNEVILYDNLVCAIDDLADEMGCGE